MNDAFQTEILKLKKNNMALIGFAVTISIPILLILKSILIDKTKIDYHEWIMTVSMLVNVVLPIMSGFFITQSMQKEYGEKTIINIVTAPVNRKTFVLSKIAVWFCWCFVVMMVTECLTIVGSLMLFPTQVTSDDLFIELFTQIGFLSYIASLPIIWIAIRQRTLFYPSMLCSSFCIIAIDGCTGIGGITSLASFVPCFIIQISTMLPVILYLHCFQCFALNCWNRSIFMSLTSRIYKVALWLWCRLIHIGDQ